MNLYFFFVPVTTAVLLPGMKHHGLLEKYFAQIMVTFAEKVKGMKQKKNWLDHKKNTLNIIQHHCVRHLSGCFSLPFSFYHCSNEMRMVLYMWAIAVFSDFQVQWFCLIQNVMYMYGNRESVAGRSICYIFIFTIYY